MTNFTLVLRSVATTLQHEQRCLTADAVCSSLRKCSIGTLRHSLWTPAASWTAFFRSKARLRIISLTSSIFPDDTNINFVGESDRQHIYPKEGTAVSSEDDNQVMDHSAMQHARKVLLDCRHWLYFRDIDHTATCDGQHRWGDCHSKAKWNHLSGVRAYYAR